MKRILVATDGSEHAERALQWAVDLVRQCGAELHVVTVIPVPAPVLGTPGAVVYDQYLQAAGEEADRLLASVREKLRAGGIAAQVHRTVGRPSQGILETGDKLDADLIVVGRRGLGRLEGILLGSVSSEVVHLARRPVVVVR